MLLPAWEMCIYGLLAVGSHLYAFYEAHQVSQSKSATGLCPLLQRFQLVAGEAAGLGLSSPGWFLLCSSARSACALPGCTPAPSEEAVASCQLGRELFPRLFCIECWDTLGGGVLALSCQGGDEGDH